jgi:hypothetical protein
MENPSSHPARITPFWNRVPQLFLYGLRPRPLILAGVLAAVSALLGSGLVELILGLVVIKYAMAALQETAEGYLVPPKLSYAVLVENYQLPIKLYVLVVGWFFLYGAVSASAGPFFSLALFVIGMLLFPAVVISLVMTESFLYAVNPLNGAALVRRIGWPYLIMFGFLFLFGIAEESVQTLFLERVSKDLLAPMWFAIDALFTIIMFHLMGYVLFQYHEELGSAKPAALAETGEELAGVGSPLLEKFIAEGNVAAATEEFAGLIKDNPHDLALRRRLYVYLISTDQHARLDKYLPAYFSALLDAGAIGDATKLYLDSVQRDQPFAPRRPGDYLPLMRELKTRRSARQAVKLAGGFHKRFPRAPETPQVYSEMARILSEDLLQDELAAKALKYVLKHFPQDAHIGEIRSQLALLEKLGDGSAGA